jgi:hypothetical protein
MQPIQPHWVTYATIFGIGAILGNLVSFLLTSWWHHQVWVKDNKKLEWRELIDAIQNAIRIMGYRYGINVPAGSLKTRDVESYFDARRKAELTLRDRIFISKTVDSCGLMTIWIELIEQGIKAEEDHKSAVRFSEMSYSLNRQLIYASREDLGLESRWFNFR